MKYIIEIEDKPINGTDLYKAKAFNSLVFDRYGLNHLETLKEYDEKGWKLTAETIDKIRDEGYRKGYDDAIDKMNNIDPRIHRGDEVIAWDTGTGVRFIAWDVECDEVHGIDEGGGDYIYPLSVCRKTGRHFNIEFKEQCDGRSEEV